MTVTRAKGWARVLAIAMVGTIAVAMAGCAPQASTEATDTETHQSNDTAVKGDYVPFDPAVEAEHTGGKAIEGSEEEELQQERIAGGAVGAVTSQNLEPLKGVVDGAEGEYVPLYGINDQAPVMGHGDNGSDCLSCHDGGSATTPLPKGHKDANLANEECVTCHAAQ